ncbi:MAG: hypothetical protein AAGE76_05235 [Pseudomonadota bacterium]
MTWLVILGVVVVGIGLAGLVVCIRKAPAIRTEKPEDARARLQGLVALNLASVSIAGLGLACVVMGLIL